MFFNKILHYTIQLAIKNPVAFKVLIYLRHKIPWMVLSVKSIVFGWRRYSIPSDIIQSVEEYASEYGFRYQTVRESSSLVTKMPKSTQFLDDDVFLRNKNIDLTSQFVATIPKGRVVTQGYVLSHNNRVLEELAMLYDNSSSKYKPIDFSHEIFTEEVSSKPAQFINGKVAVLAIPFAQHNYYHWMMDLMPRLNSLKLSGYDLQNDIDYFYVNSTAINFQKETLRVAGIPDKKIIDSIWHPHICARELIVSSRPGTDCLYDYQTVKFLRDLFSDDLQKVKSKRLYLNRHNVRYRKILNESRIEELLKSHGFESVSLDELSVSEQVALLSSSEIVISGHGAALTNLVFCQEGTKVLEMFHYNNVHPMYWGISNLLDLDYYCIKSRRVCNNAGLSNDQGNFSDMDFDLSKIEETLDLMLKDELSNP